MACTFVVLKSSKVTSIKDLVGKKVALGAPGSSAEIMARHLFTELGIIDKVKLVSIGSEEIPNKLKEKEIECFAVMADAVSPNTRIAEVAATHPIRLVDLSNDLDALFKKYPVYEKIEMPEGFYKDSQSKATLFGLTPIWVTSIKVPEDVIYNFMKISHSEPAVAALAKVLPGQAHDIKDPLTVMPIPLHPGAEKFGKKRRQSPNRLLISLDGNIFILGRGCRLKWHRDGNR